MISRSAQEGDATEIAFASIDSPVGLVTVATTDTGPVAVGWGQDELLVMLSARMSPRLTENRARLDEVCRQLDEYFSGHRRHFDLRIDWSLSSGFRLAVLQELVQVPCGEVVTYAQLAARVCNPRASRAVGGAMATNPLPLIVPCHRVLRSDGGLGNYSGGSGAETKAWLLRHEGVGIPVRST